MQNNSENIGQKRVNKQEKTTTDKPVVTQAQKKTMQKVVKNPLMTKNPLMKTASPIIKQVQPKLALQTNVTEFKIQELSNENKTKALGKEQQDQNPKKDVQEKNQQIKIQKSSEENKVREEKQELKSQQIKSQSNAVKADQNNKNPKVAKNPLMLKQNTPQETNSIIQTKTNVVQISKKQSQKIISKIIVEKNQEKTPQNKQKVDSETISQVKQQKLQYQISIDQKKGAKLQSVQTLLENINENKQQTEILEQKKLEVKEVIQQKKLQVKEEAKPNLIKVEPHKAANSSAVKKNPLIKSEMIFKPADIKQNPNPLFQKSNEQPKSEEIVKQQVENKKKDEKTQIKVETAISANYIKETTVQQKIAEKTSQIKQIQTEKLQNQAISRRRLQSIRFSIGMISESRQEQKEISKQVVIKITDSFQKGTALSKYMVYQLQGTDKLGPFRISRKYSQFQAIRNIIRQRWPGCFIPSIHSKSQLKNEAHKQKQIRIVLQNFLLGLSYSQHIFYKQQVQLFLRSPQIDIIQMVKEMPVLKAKDVINRYNSCFGEEMFQNVTQSQNSARIKKFIAQLRKIINSLSSMSIKVQTLSESYDNYATKLSRFGQISKAYEQLCLSEYTNNSRDKAIILKEESNNINKLNDLSKYNPFYKLYIFINNQTRDAQSFLEIMIASQLFVLHREDLERQIKQIETELLQISLGHKTLRTITTRKSKQDVSAQLQARKKKLCDEKQNIVQIFKITEIILANKEIQFFKTFKRNTYRGVLKEWINLSGEINPQLLQLWKFIEESTRQALKSEFLIQSC